MIEPSLQYDSIQEKMAQGQFSDALRLCLDMLKTGSEDTILWCALGEIEDALGHQVEKKKAYQKVISLEPEHAFAHNNLGVIAQERLDYYAALKHYLKAYEIEPKEVLYTRNLAQIYLVLGEREKAMVLSRETLVLEPEAATSYHLLAQAFLLFGDIKHAEAAFQQAIYLNKSLLVAYYHLGELYQEQRNFPQAIEWFERLIFMQAKYEHLRDRKLLALSYNYLAFCLREQGKMSESIDAYQTAMSIFPMDSTRVSMSLLLPPVYQSHDDLQVSRKLFIKGLDELEARQNEMLQPVDNILTTPFYLAYQGLNDRAVLERLGSFFSSFLPENLCLNVPYPGEKIRIGFVSNCFYNHSVSDYFSGLILGLPREQFEIYLFTTTGMLEDDVTQALREGSDGFFSSAPDLENLRKMIAKQSLDVLVYPDLGMDPVSYFLACTRLAPQQCVLMGHPVTSGLSTIDYYISSEHQEIPEAQAHYTEKLIRFNQVPAFYKKPKMIEPLSRRALGLPSLGHLYICPQTLYKIHPDFDAILQNILDLDRKAFIVFFREEGSDVHDILKMRFKQTIVRKNHRIKFLPRLKYQAFLSVLQVADVILDSVHFGGGSTSYLAFAAGTPVVTWPSEFLRGRTTYALYQQMGIDFPIAKDHQDYARIAVKIAQDKGCRAMLKSKIMAASEGLFSSQACIDELALFLTQIGRKTDDS